jgi:hypothetical protein
VERLGPLPIINSFLDRLGADELLDRYVPTTNPRTALPYGKGLGVLLRSMVVEREPIYRQQETVETFAAGSFGLAPQEVEGLADDQIGRALDELFDADRGALLTEVFVRLSERFDVTLDRVHKRIRSLDRRPLIPGPDPGALAAGWGAPPPPGGRRRDVSGGVPEGHGGAGRQAEGVDGDEKPGRRLSRDALRALAPLGCTQAPSAKSES